MESYIFDPHLGRRERLRLRVQNEGLESLKPHEILEFLLYYVVPRQDVNGVAHDLIEKFGSVGTVLRAETRQLMSCGLSRRAAVWLCLIGEATLAFDAIERGDGACIINFFHLFSYACSLYENASKPGSIQLCMDASGRVIFQREITPSRAWGEPIILRDALIDAMSMKASSVIIVEFTGRESHEPGKYDFDSAVRYSNALYAAKCRLLDVVLIGESGSTSLRQMDKIPEQSNRARPYNASCAAYLREMPDTSTMGLRTYIESLNAARGMLTGNPAENEND